MSQKPKHSGSSHQHGSKSGKRNIGTGAKVVIVVFAVLMALALMLPFLSTIVASNNEAQSSSQSQSDSSSSTDSSTDSSDDSSADDVSLDGVPENLQSTAKTYAGTVQTLESKLDDDPNNLATLINLADDYMNWGYASLKSSSSDDEKSYSNALLQKAVEYFDRYLALHDSNSAKVNRALCQYYLGDTDGATKALEQITTDAPNFGPGWANLGLVYEQAGETQKAIDAYQKAVEADPNNEYGARSFANQRLVALQSQQSSSSDSTSSTDGSSSETTSSDGSTSSDSSSSSNSLANTLNSSSGTGL